MHGDLHLKISICTSAPEVPVLLNNPAMGHGECTAIWNSLSFYLRSAVGMDPKPTDTLLDFTWDSTTQTFRQTQPVEVPADPACLRQLNVYLDTSPGALRGSCTEFAICFRPK